MMILNRTSRLLAATALTALALSACSVEMEIAVGDDDRIDVGGSGHIVTETRPVTGFTAVSLFTEGDVTIVQGETEGLTIETDDNLMEYLETNVRDGVLQLLVPDDSDVDLEPTRGIEYRISAVSLDAVRLYGAGSIDIYGLTADRLSVTLAGAGDIDIDGIEAREVDVALSGVGSVVLGGRVDSERLLLTGAGDIEAAGVAADEATVTLTGVGDIDVRATGRLDATLSGIGDVTYHDSPSITSSVTGLGSLTHVDDR